MSGPNKKTRGVPPQFSQPLDVGLLLRKKQSLKQELLEQSDFLEKRIAILGGSTTAEVVDQLELFLLSHGIKPVFYQSEYNRYYEEAVFPSDDLIVFEPELVYIHTGTININTFPCLTDSEEVVAEQIQHILDHYRQAWGGIEKNLKCPIIQNNFEEPWCRPLGNLDGSDYRGRSRFIARLNEAFAQESSRRSAFYIHDIHYLSARFGMDRWFNPRLWYLYKYALDMEMIPHFAHHLSALMASLWGKASKCLVLDLDFTLWGGVVGDDGLEGIQIGNETAEAEAYTDFQCYIQEMKSRGIILAACSKNELETARHGFTHPDNVLQVEDFVAFKANWEPKPTNIEAIADEINIGLDSLVFIDDNPAEREIVRTQLPGVQVPEIGNDVTDFIRSLDQASLFETVSLSVEDVKRSQQYRDNKQRKKQEAHYASYDDFLQSLNMVAEITPFQPIYMERITQLINKTNQFNLTTRRCTLPEVELMAASDRHITLSARLQDKFGDNGLVSIVAGEMKATELHLDLWLMSCRVLKRGMEEAMFMELCRVAQEKKIKKIIGYYFPTPKNKMVALLFKTLGFSKRDESGGATVWQFDLAKGLPKIKHTIEVIRE